MIEVVKAFTLEHVRWLGPLEEEALREGKRARVEGRKLDPDTRRHYDAVTKAVRDANCWFLCDCLPEEPEQPVIVPCQRPGGISLGNLPNAEVAHDVNCVFRLLGESSQGVSGDFVNPLSHKRHDAALGEPGQGDEPWSGRSRAVPTVANVLKRFIREARLHTLAGAERFPSPAEWLAELKNAAAAFPVAQKVPASEVLFTDPESWPSDEFREDLDKRARNWPKGSPPCGYLCWVAHDVDGHDINGRTRDAGHVRVTSPVASKFIHGEIVEGPYLFLGALEQSEDGPGWQCCMAWAQPIADLELPIPVDSGYERLFMLSLAGRVRGLQSDTELEEALGGFAEFELQRPLFPEGVHGRSCEPDALLTVTRPGGPAARARDDPFDDSDKARYVLEVMGLGDAKYEKSQEKTHPRMEQLGRLIRLEGRQFGSVHNGLEHQLERIARRIKKDLIWRWAES